MMVWTASELKVAKALLSPQHNAQGYCLASRPATSKHRVRPARELSMILVVKYGVIALHQHPRRLCVVSRVIVIVAVTTKNIRKRLKASPEIGPNRHAICVCL